MTELVNIGHSLVLFLGLRLVEGGLRAKKLKIQQNRVRESIARVNPVLSAVRRHSFKIVRRKYSVPCPNALRHIDGDHKLIEPYRIVIHGGIDGYSRVIVYLASVAKWLAHLPFTSKAAGSNLTKYFLNVTRTQSSCEKSKSQRSAESRGFSPGTPVSSHRES
jgi:hypothetical protein